MKIIGDWSARPAEATYGTVWTVYPKGERGYYSQKAMLYPASDGKSYVISMNRRPLDARPSLDEALQHVVTLLNMERNIGSS